MVEKNRLRRTVRFTRKAGFEQPQYLLRITNFAIWAIPLIEKIKLLGAKPKTIEEFRQALLLTPDLSEHSANYIVDLLQKKRSRKPLDKTSK